MTADPYWETQRLRERLAAELGDVAYRGVPVAGLVRVPVYALKKLAYTSRRHHGLDLALAALAALRQCGRLLACRVRRQVVPPGIDRPAFLFLIDHNSPRFHEMHRAVLAHFLARESVVVTVDPAIVPKYEDTAATVHLDRLIAGRTLRPAHFRILRRVLSAPLARRESLGFRARLAPIVLRACAAIDAYSDLLQASRIQACLALSDTHWHEFLAVTLARAQGIRTYTLQHGLVEDLHVPIASTAMLTWGESTVEQLLRLGVPRTQVVVVGRPGFDRDVEVAQARGPELRAAFCRRHGLDSQRPVAMIFATNFGPTESREMLRSFAAACPSRLSPVIKLRPTATPQDVAWHQQLVREFLPGRNVPVLTNVPPLQCFTAADIVVTAHSTAGMEALPFGCAVILQDMFPAIDMQAMPHYDDVTVVRTTAELRSALSALAEDARALERRQQASLSAAGRHVVAGRGNDAARAVAEIVRFGSGHVDAPSALAEATG